VNPIPRPLAKEWRTNASAVAAAVPAKMGPPLPAGRLNVAAPLLPQPKEREDCQNHDNQSDEVDKPVHRQTPSVGWLAFNLASGKKFRSPAALQNDLFFCWDLRRLLAA